MRKIVFTIFVLLTSHMGLAQEVQPQNHPQYFFQAAEGQHLLTPGFIYQKTTGKIQTMNERELTVTNLAATYEYGFFDSFALGGTLSLASSKLETQGLSSSSSGFEDLQLYARTFYRFENFNFRYGLELNISPDSKKYKSNGFQANEYSGANTVTPYAGFDIPLGTSTIGFKWSRELLLGKEVSENYLGEKFKYTGGTNNNLEAFYEYTSDTDNIWGAAFAYVTTSDSKDELGAKEEHPSYYGIHLYSANKVSEQWTLLPNFLYASNIDEKANNLRIESFGSWAVSIAGRYSF